MIRKIPLSRHDQSITKEDSKVKVDGDRWMYDHIDKSNLFFLFCHDKSGNIFFRGGLRSVYRDMSIENKGII